MNALMHAQPHISPFLFYLLYWFAFYFSHFHPHRQPYLSYYTHSYAHWKVCGINSICLHLFAICQRLGHADRSRLFAKHSTSLSSRVYRLAFVYFLHIFLQNLFLLFLRTLAAAVLIALLLLLSSFAIFNLSLLFISCAVYFA